MSFNDKVLFSVANDGNQTGDVNSAAFALNGRRGLSVQSVWDVNSPGAKTTVPGTLEVQTLTFPAGSAAANGDYAVVENSSGTKYGLSLSKNTAEIQTLTFLSKAASTSGEFFVFLDSAGTEWAISVDKTGSAAAPTATGWTRIAAAKKRHVDISSASTAPQVAALFELAMDAMTGFSAVFATDDTAADGTMLLTSVGPGPIGAGSPYKPAAGTGSSAGAGTSITGVVSTAGILASAPTGAIWTAIASAAKATVLVDGLTAVQVAAAAELALNALTGYTAATTTDDTAADGTMTLTQVEPGATVNPVPKSKTDSGAGSILGVQSTGGVGGVNLGSDTWYTAAHGYTTGIKGQCTTGTTLPTGLSLATDYYLIVTGVDTYAFATSRANALAGTKINLTARGTGTHTFTPTALSATTKLQKSVDGTNWYDLHDDEIIGAANSQTISADGSMLWTVPDACYPFIRQSVTIAAGQLSLASSAYAGV